jgi:hypothetical protein
MCDLFVVALTGPSGIKLESDTPQNTIPAEPKSPNKLSKSPTKLPNKIKEDMDEDEPDNGPPDEKKEKD